MPEEAVSFRLNECWIYGYRALHEAGFRLGSTSLIVGVNGSGKTSALRSIALLLEDVARRIGPKAASGHRPAAFDFRKPHIGLNAELLTHEGVYQLSRSWRSADGAVSEISRHASPVSGIPRLAQSYWEALEKDEPKTTLPLLCFYPISRAVTEVPLRVRKEEPVSRRDAYVRAFTAERHFQSFFQWFREQEDIENEQRIPDPHLSAVRLAIEKAMGEEYRNLRVSRRPRLRMLIDKAGESLSIQQLSDGEQGVLTLIGDLARRAAILNPHLPDPLQSPGCVLVDEIDQHLHPQWQRRVVETLRRIFPNLQFVFTSHSPIVCGSVEPDSLIVLKDGKAEPGSVYGWSMAAILKTVFDIDERPAPVHRDLVALDQAIDEGDFTRARAVLNGLLANLPPDDPEIVRANVMLPVLEQVARDR